MAHDDLDSLSSPHLVLIDGDRSGGPRVTPEPAPADDGLVKILIAGAVGAVIGSYAAFRFLRRYVGFVPRSDR